MLIVDYDLVMIIIIIFPLSSQRDLIEIIITLISFYSLFVVALLLSLICLLFVPSVYLCHLRNWTLCC